MTTRSTIAIAFLVFQAGLVAASQFGDSRWFSWAPHTTQTFYQLEVTNDGRALGPDEIRRRYGIPHVGWEAHAIQNVRDLVIRHALTAGRGERTTVTLRYSVNGRPEETWSWSSSDSR